MKFYLYDSDAFKKAEKKDIICLYPSNWDDWFKFSTLYSIYYFRDDEESVQIGSIKIGQKNMSSDQRRPELPEFFETLEDVFFSLGQDVSYYERLNQLGIDFRDEVLNALNDIALNEEIYKESLKENVTRISLLRSISQTSVEGQFRRLANGDSELTPYSFKFQAPKHTKSQSDMILVFNVVPKSNPPTNIHVIIGRNGVGKTYLFNNMISSLLNGNLKNGKDGYFINSIEESKKLFANLISVSFSAFDETSPITEKRDKTKYLNYSYIGLKRPESNNEKLPPKSPTILKNEFIKSVEMCKRQGKKDRWIKALEMLEADPIFNEAEVSSIAKVASKEEFKEVASLVFNRLSSGHKIVLLTITRLVETIEERSLVLLDEPEGYLHPPLLAAFIRALSEILTKRNAIAIIGTHSPVVLQEVPRSCVWKLRRHGATAISERLDIESFGENVGLLTQEVFGLEVTESGFHNIIRKIALESENYDLAIQKLNNQLGQEGKAILRTLINNK